MTDRPTATRITVSPATLRRAEALGFGPGSDDVLTWALDRLDDEHRAADLHRDLNRRVAGALGLLEERVDPELGPYLPSWHDMPEQVAALVAERDRLAAVLAEVRWLCETMARDSTWPMARRAYRDVLARLTAATTTTEENTP